MSQRCMPNKRCDVTYIISVAVLELASQEVDVIANSTNENSWNLYGYDEMTKPQFFIQTQVLNQQDVIIIKISSSR